MKPTIGYTALLVYFATSTDLTDSYYHANTVHMYTCMYLVGSGGSGVFSEEAAFFRPSFSTIVLLTVGCKIYIITQF